MSTEEDIEKVVAFAKHHSGLRIVVDDNVPEYRVDPDSGERYKVLGYHLGDALIMRTEMYELVKEALAPTPKVRGRDYPCEACGALDGATIDDGWQRCNACGYPSP